MWAVGMETNLLEQEERTVSGSSNCGMNSDSRSGSSPWTGSSYCARRSQSCNGLWTGTASCLCENSLQEWDSILHVSTLMMCLYLRSMPWQRTLTCLIMERASLSLSYIRNAELYYWALSIGHWVCARCFYDSVNSPKRLSQSMSLKRCCRGAGIFLSAYTGSVSVAQERPTCLVWMLYGLQADGCSSQTTNQQGPLWKLLKAKVAGRWVAGREEADFKHQTCRVIFAQEKPQTVSAALHALYTVTLAGRRILDAWWICPKIKPCAYLDEERLTHLFFP